MGIRHDTWNGPGESSMRRLIASCAISFRTPGTMCANGSEELAHKTLNQPARTAARYFGVRGRNDDDDDDDGRTDDDDDSGCPTADPSIPHETQI